jgi:hypothetical protein
LSASLLTFAYGRASAQGRENWELWGFQAAEPESGIQENESLAEFFLNAPIADNS